MDVFPGVEVLRHPQSRVHAEDSVDLQSQRSAEDGEVTQSDLSDLS